MDDRDYLDVSVAIAKLTTIAEQNTKRLDDLDSRTRTLESKPAKSWESVTGAAVACIVTSILTYVLATSGIIGG